MATALNLGNANGKTITLRNPDTNNSDITVEMDKVVVKDANGNVVLASGSKIQGDFSNGNNSLRTAIQTSTSNSATRLEILPNGSSTTSSVHVRNSQDAINSSLFAFGITSTESQVHSAISGTGTYLPIAFYTGGSRRMSIDTDGNVGIGVVPSAWRSDLRALDIANGAIVSLNGDTEIHSNSYVSSTGNTYKLNGYANKFVIGEGLGNFKWCTAPSGTAGNAITWTNAMILDAGGDLTVPHTYTNTTASAANMFVDSTGKFFRSTSSKQYKTDIEDIDKTYVDSFFNNARPIYYKSLSNNDNPNWGYWGFIAEEIAEFDKRLVHWRHQTKDIEVEKETILEDGSIETVLETQTVKDEDKPLVAEGVMYERITVLLTAKVQEQQEIINDLKTRLEILEGGK